MQRTYLTNVAEKNLITVSDQKIYRCPFAANSDRLKSIPHNSKNFIEIQSDPKK